MCATCLQGLRLSSNKAEGKCFGNKRWEIFCKHSFSMRILYLSKRKKKCNTYLIKIRLTTGKLKLLFEQRYIHPQYFSVFFPNATLFEKTLAPVRSISTWPPSTPWSVSYTTCKGSPDQPGMAMVRRSSGAAGRSQWKAQSSGGIWALLMAEGSFAPLSLSWAVLGLILRELSNEKCERQEMDNTRADTEK